jgi:hypothetical protein
VRQEFNKVAIEIKASMKILESGLEERSKDD